jgi:16S rRNA (guanine966-N2)-methyltransferase
LFTMRIVSGTAKGRRLAPVPPGTRPVSDRAREGLFSSLGALVEASEVLDLYAGTGALGIEALSRGAAGVTFVDSSSDAIRTIRANLHLTALGDRANIHKRDVLRFLDESNDSYSMGFADPPYAIEQDQLNALIKAVQSHLRSPGWRFVLTRGIKGYTPVIPVDWRVARELRYGDTLVLVYEEG